MTNAQHYQWNTISLGTCYYPEQWAPSLWREDLRRMKAVGIDTIRIAEFAWSKIEPEEGVFRYDFFDDFLDVAEEERMQVIMGTPTATPPVWLTEKYPEVLNARKDGVLYRHGMRRHYNYNSPKYQELCARIVEKEAEHYAGRPCIVGWQIDNEINCEIGEFYSVSDTLAFRKFLQEKYQTLNALNDAWGAVFWNQTYTEWSQIYVPRTTINDMVNPHQMLDYIRFISVSAIRFCKLQSDILRKYLKPGDFITTNGMFGNLDNHRMAEECLDVFTYDSYPNFALCLDQHPRESKNLNDRRWSMHLMETRSVCPHFGIMEQQSGANGWSSGGLAPAPKPGQMTLWALQSIAHGADYISFFRWRTAAFGTEMYWHGILDYDNGDNRRLAEIGRLHERLNRIQEIAGAEYRASFALLKDYDNCFDAQLDNWHGYVAYGSESELFVVSQISHTPMDVVYLGHTDREELQKYPVLIYPHPEILTEEQCGLLEQYVRRGGCLIIGARAGQKDERGHCVMKRMPGLLGTLTQTQVMDYTAVGPADDAVSMNWNGKEVETGSFHDILSANGPGAKVLAVYSGDYYAGEPALIETKVGAGRVLHFGGTFTRGNIPELLSYLGIYDPYRSRIELPADCELAVRTKGGNTYLFVLNYTKEEQEICLKQEMLDMDTGAAVRGTVGVGTYGGKIYKVLPE